MKVMLASIVMLSLALPSASLGDDEDLKSGPQPGASLGAFKVEKCAGNETDKVESGQTLCYRCMLRNRPVVAVFARKPDKQLRSLLKDIDAMIVKYKKAELASFVSLLGDDKKQLKAAAEALVKQSKVKHIAVVVPDEHVTGPRNYKLNPKADLTILVYREGKVEANFTLSQKNLDKESIKRITAAAAKLVKFSS